MIKDLTGQQFGRLTVIENSGLRNKYRAVMWTCKCICDNISTVRGADLSRGYVKSCGCLVSRHGHSKGGKPTKTYISWYCIKRRCLNPNNKDWSRYGGRGITICERWLKFENFLKDMGERPPGTTINRINNNGNYEPSNCEWATAEVQANNRG